MKDVINLQLSGYDLDKNASTIIYDMQGRVVNTIIGLQNLTMIITSQLTSGNYLIQVTTEEESYTKQFYKN